MRVAAPLFALAAVALATASSASADPSPPQPQPPRSQQPLQASLAKKPLRGRFLHVTDFHPDPHYAVGSDYDDACHSSKKLTGAGVDEGDMKKGSGAGKWGAAVSDCDSPMSLVDYTFDWLKKEWADEIDFIIWTGDNARHDIDRALPRTPKEIFSLNEMMVKKMVDTFGKDMPIVPSIGNNDIYPHNVLAKGPNHITEKFLTIWKHFIPDGDRHVFERGAYFSKEVIPDRLAVISLNTLYWYDSNTLVDGCQDNSHDPGALQMDWLEVQLQNYRDRGMQVWMSGHVPPHLGHYFDNCYLRYGDIALRYQDTIVGHLFGHMNVDHFFFIDVDELESTEIKTESKKKKSKGGKKHLLDYTDATVNATEEIFYFGPEPRHGSHLESSGRIGVLGRNGNNGLSDSLKKDFGEMPGPQKLKLKDYAVMTVSPSIIPTYLPSLRIFSYNVSDFAGVPSLDEDESEFADDDAARPIDIEKSRKGGHRHDKPKSDCKLPENEDKPHCTFKNKPRFYNKTSPSRSNGPMSPLGYVQFYLPDVDKQTKAPPPWVIEYSTFKAKALLPSNLTGEKKTQELPLPLHLLPGYDPDVLASPDLMDTLGDLDQIDEDDLDISVYDWKRSLAVVKGSDDVDADADLESDQVNAEETLAMKKDKFKRELKRITPWAMKDLTIKSYVKLARKLVAEKKLWQKFTQFMFVSSD